MYKILLIILFLFSLSTARSQVTDAKLISIIRENDVSEFDMSFSRHKINDLFGKDSLTLLSYSLFYKSNDIVKYLLDRNADINKISGGLTPVMWASRIGNAEGLRMLISKDAKINEIDNEGNSALIYASSIGCRKCVEALLEGGADIYQVNSYGRDAEFYSRSGQHTQITKALRMSRIGSMAFKEDMTDGPHIEWVDDEKIRMTYIYYKSAFQNIREKSKKVRVKNDEAIIPGFGKDNKRYPIQEYYPMQPSIYDDIDSILIIGDIHGNFKLTRDILLNAGIISEDLNWKWGSGHLIFIGDIFDKGDHVTEILWFIKKLGKEALEDGGRVHFIYGNHEIMNLAGDNRYISDKYLYMSEKAGIKYSDLFTKDYDLGRWLRSLNTVLKINDILIVHAGISPSVVDRQLTIEDINTLMHKYVNQDLINASDSLGILLLGGNGPLWYRGYVMKLSGEEMITRQELNEIREFYDVNRIIFGHTPADRFRMSFNNMLIGLDVSASKDPGYEKALLIESGKFYKVFSDGSKERMDPE